MNDFNDSKRKVKIEIDAWNEKVENEQKMTTKTNNEVKYSLYVYVCVIGMSININNKII